VEGPVLDNKLESFTGYHPLPVRHGMTVGELARLFNRERKIGADLEIVPIEGWNRSDLFDRTNLLLSVSRAAEEKSIRQGERHQTIPSELADDGTMRGKGEDIAPFGGGQFPFNSTTPQPAPHRKKAFQ
jgi:hypothetical protein